MWITIKALLCCMLATTLATNEAGAKKKDEARGKRNLEYSISHQHFPAPNYRSERRISTAQFSQFPSLTFSGQQQYAQQYGKAPPPYAVQMEPLVHYSQRDPLYDLNSLSFLEERPNDLKPKEDLIQEHSSHISRSLYGPREPVKHIVERPVYIKEPEPIIEIIIKESNITLPPLPTPVTPAPRKKEQVQVFYVKYKKNPNGGYGKDSVVYDKPIAAISPHVESEEPVQVEPPLTQYEVPATVPPVPSTTLRAIVKPDSESYHADKGIHITFGKQENDQYKRSNDDQKEESAPEPAISHPQSKQIYSTVDRQLPPPSHFFPARPLSFPIHNSPPPPPPPNFNGESRFPFYRTIGQSVVQFKPPPPPQFGRQFLQSHQQLPSTRPPGNFQLQPFPIRNGPPVFSQQLPGIQHVQFNQPFSNIRQPVPYQPFEQLRPQQSSQIQFPRTHTHFPIHQHLPLLQQQRPFNSPFTDERQHLQATHQQFQNNLRHDELIRQQKQPQIQAPQQFSQQLQQQPQRVINQEQFPINNHQQAERFIPPGGELINSVAKYEQHISIPAGGDQPQHAALSQSSTTDFRQQQQLQSVASQIQLSQRPSPQQQLQLVQRQPSQQQQFQPDQQQLQLEQRQPIQQQLQPAQQQLQLTQRQPIQQQLQSVQQQLQFAQHQANQQQLQSVASQIQLSPQQLQSAQLLLALQQQQFQSPQPQLQLAQQQLLQPIQQVRYNSPDSIQRQIQEATSSERTHQHFVSSVQPSLAQNQFQQSTAAYQTTPKPFLTTARPIQSSTTESPKASSEVAPQQQKLTEADLKALNIQLPDEVPEELREQLLSSGILKNAQISVLDYDKVGDIPISALPPDQLANFYSAGGGQQIAAGSEKVETVLTKDGTVPQLDEMEGSESEISESKAEAPVEMKVVHYDPGTEQGKRVQESYVNEGATQVDPVALNDQQYNRYLPVKVNGAAFPIPDVPELKGLNITSVVILAPVDYSLQENQRASRDVENNIRGSRQLATAALKTLIQNPTIENYKIWLDKENKTVPEKQAVVLLVTGNNITNNVKEKEIFMYDIATETVSKLSGELSSAFVDAAETNSNSKIGALASEPSNVVETRVPYPEGKSLDRSDTFPENTDLEDSASEFVEAKIPLIDPTNDDNFSEASEQLESFVDVSGMPIQPQDDLAVAASDNNYISISSGYSKTGSNLLTV